MPVSGKILDIEYTEGEFLPAYEENLEKRNERNRILCQDTRDRRFEVWQIAGLIARRIHCWKRIEETFNRGERFGMIAFGSRTDLIIPSDVRPTTSLQQTVRGGRTEIARG